MSLVYTAFVPHPPVLIPEVGRGQETICHKTIDAYQILVQRIVKAKTETIVLISPHASLLEVGITLLTNKLLQGDFAAFGVPNVSLSFPNDEELVNKLSVELPRLVTREGKLDHGAMVPLYFLNKEGWRGNVILLSMPLNQTGEYGRLIGEVLRKGEKRCALVASGDLSHRLREDGPYGFNQAGPQFDQAIVDGLKGDLRKIASIDSTIIEEAGECGYRSLRLALSAQEATPEVLSYEGPFGVGYLVADLYHVSPLVTWARFCLTQYLSGRKLEDLPLPEGPEFQVSCGCFVTLKLNGELRGCIGTTQAWQKNLALEIQHNAIAAGTEDPRFWPVNKDDLAAICFSVDVLGELEKVRSTEELDPWRYGVVVRARGKTGLLLPCLEGINTVTEQVGIAKQKAGLQIDEAVELWRFEVVRHHE
ncbi:MAG: AmmeMemoRadiSam system protein A [Desulfitobacteriaceae bacterium]